METITKEILTSNGETRKIQYTILFDTILKVEGIDLQEYDEIETIEFSSKILNHQVNIIERNVLDNREKSINNIILHPIKKIILGPSIKGVQESAFFKVNVSCVDFGKCKIIGTEAFAMSTISTVIFNNPIKVIGMCSFRGCTNLTEVQIKSSCENILDKAFSDCTKLISFKHNGNINFIGVYAFTGCSSLKKFIWPEKSKVIKYGTFYRCYKLNNIIINNESISIIDDFDATKIKKIDITNAKVYFLSDDVCDNSKIKIIKPFYGVQMPSPLA